MNSPKPVDTSRARGDLQLFAGDGTRTRLSAEQWREDVLPAELALAQDDAERLRALVEVGLEDGLAEDVVDAARRVVELAPDEPRAVALLARTLEATGRDEEARELLESHAASLGDSAAVLDRLARLRLGAGGAEEALRLLRRALAADPNDRASLEHWKALHARHLARDEADAEASSGSLEACLAEIANEPKAWRPQVDLGRLALERGEDEIALDCFRSAIARCGGNAEAVRAVGYTLSDAGRVDELIDICAELDTDDEAEDRGPDVLRIFERLRKGRAIVDDLLERELPLLAHHFGEIETALEAEEEEDADVEGQLVMAFEGAPTNGTPDPGTPLRAFSYRGPLFGLLMREALALLPSKSSDSPRISLFAASDEAFSGTGRFGTRSDPVNALQVAMLPPLLTEIVALMTDARAYCCLPYRDGNGLARRAGPYAFADMSAASAAEAPDFVLAFHASRDEDSPWVELTLWDVAGGCAVGEVRERFEEQLVDVIPSLARRVLELLESGAGVSPLGPRAPVRTLGHVDGEIVEALADLLDLALADLSIAPRSKALPEERCQRLLALARRFPGELIARVAAVSAVVACIDSDVELSEELRSTARDLVETKYTQGELAGQSLATLLPELAERAASL